ncbi:MAG: MFS transporter [Chlamydiia bacterium]|nr:MFS transporter [Chlamydiia bacterium]
MKHHLCWNKPRVLPLTHSTLPWIQLCVIVLVTISAVVAGFAVIIADTSVQGSLVIGEQKNLWFSISYFLLIATIVPIANWSADRFGQKCVFFIGSVFLLIPTLFCAWTTNYWVMMVFRSLSALGAGSIFPTSLTLIDLAFPPKQKTFAIAIYIAAAFGIGTTGGIFLGGYCAEFIGWPVIFMWIAAPAPLAFLAIWLFFPETEKKRGISFDLIGTFFYLILIGSLVTGLSDFKQPWNTEGIDSKLIILSAVLFILSFYGFIWRESTASQPLMNISLFKIRPFCLGNIAIFIVGSTFFSTSTNLTKIFETDLLYSKYHLSLLQLPLGICIGIFGALSGLLSKKVGIRPLATMGMVLVSISCFTNHSITIQSDHAQYLWLQVLRGTGIGMALGPFTALALKRIRPENIGQAAVIITIFRQFGGALGGIIIDLIRNIRFPFHLLRFGEQMSLTSPALERHLDATDTFLTDQAGCIPAVIPGVSEGFTEAASVRGLAELREYAAAQADILSINDGYWLIGWVASVTLVIITFFMLRAWWHERQHTP